MVIAMRFSCFCYFGGGVRWWVGKMADISSCSSKLVACMYYSVLRINVAPHIDLDLVRMSIDVHVVQ